MAVLFTNHTSLFNLFRERSAIKQYASDASAAMAAGPVSANAVVGMAQQFHASLANVVSPITSDATRLDAVSDYADTQFVGAAEWSPGLLKTLLAALVPLCQNCIAECRACIPRDGSNRILKDTWAADGSVSVLQLQPADTVALRTALDALVAAIPE